jgi:hypothetical protein
MKVLENTKELLWRDGIGEIWQRTKPNSTYAHSYYYVYRLGGGHWRAGRYWFSREIDFRLDFSSAKAARDYFALYDKDSTVIVAS